MDPWGTTAPPIIRDLDYRSRIALMLTDKFLLVFVGWWCGGWKRLWPYSKLVGDQEEFNEEAVNEIYQYMREQGRYRFEYHPEYKWFAVHHYMCRFHRTDLHTLTTNRSEGFSMLIRHAASRSPRYQRILGAVERSAEEIDQLDSSVSSRIRLIMVFRDVPNLPDNTYVLDLLQYDELIIWIKYGADDITGVTIQGSAVIPWQLHSLVTAFFKNYMDIAMGR